MEQSLKETYGLFWKIHKSQRIQDKSIKWTSKKECKTYIIKKNTLGVIWQKEVTIEEERKGKLLATDLITSGLYAVKLLNTKGCVILCKTIA